MLVSEIATRVKRTFGDEAGVQIADADIIRWVNDAMREIAIAADLMQTLASTALISSQNSYALPPDILTLRSVRYNGIKLTPLSPSEFEEYIDSTASIYPTGRPTHFSVYATSIQLYPAPDNNAVTGGSLQIFYTRRPLETTTTNDTPELPVQYHNRIVEYCLQQAYELDENWGAAQAKAQQFEKGVNELRNEQTWSARDFYPSITTLPEDSEGAYQEMYW